MLMDSSQGGPAASQVAGGAIVTCRPPLLRENARAPTSEGDLCPDMVLGAVVAVWPHTSLDVRKRIVTAVLASIDRIAPRDDF